MVTDLVDCNTDINDVNKGNEYLEKVIIKGAEAT